MKHITNELMNNKLFRQIFRFGIVGGLAFIIDYAVLIICKEFFGISVLLSAAIAFTISVIVNSILSVVWVFDVDKNKSAKKNFVIFIVLSIVGLGITEFEEAEIRMEPNEYVTLNDEDKQKFQDLVDALDELEDVQNVAHNVEL